MIRTKVNQEGKETGLRKYMSRSQREKLGSLPTTHLNCKEKTGVSRPGKTARDRAKLKHTIN